jgi:hypothetical protein
VLIGELSEQKTGSPPIAGSAPKAGGYNSVDYLYEVARPPSTASAPLITDGLALHAYQHIGGPDTRGTSGEVGKQTGVPCA